MCMKQYWIQLGTYTKCVFYIYIDEFAKEPFIHSVSSLAYRNEIEAKRKMIYNILRQFWMFICSKCLHKLTMFNSTWSEMIPDWSKLIKLNLEAESL